MLYEHAICFNKNVLRHGGRRDDWERGQPLRNCHTLHVVPPVCECILEINLIPLNADNTPITENERKICLNRCEYIWFSKLPWWVWKQSNLNDYSVEGFIFIGEIWKMESAKTDINGAKESISFIETSALKSIF